MTNALIPKQEPTEAQERIGLGVLFDWNMELPILPEKTRFVAGKIAQIIERIAALEQERDRAKAANELDRRELWSFVRAIDEEITGRMWLIEGRGSYEWDDDRYRQEFGWAVRAIQEKLEPLRKICHDLTNCPKTENGVDSVRRLEQERDQLLVKVERLGAPVSDAEWAIDNWKESGGSMRGFIDVFIAARKTP